ncbi:MAG: MetQ/NlpA family ABC transporter substrate-binding protein [Bacillaceae bacterium]|nr:MetQ/NlpA family ABC transporter substrate-binding protein [Bacillaceae bacterium]
MKNFSKIVMTIIALLFIAGCTEKTSGKEEDLYLKIGLMPAVDALPILVAKEKGFFEELGLELEAEMFTNAIHRQTALQTGELDGAITDLIAIINNSHNDFKTKVVTSTDFSFAFLTASDFDPEGTKQIGLMEVSVSNYLTDTYIAPILDIEHVFIPEIPTRLEMITTGHLDMAFIPEPLASIGQLSGLVKHTTLTTDQGYSPDAVVFTAEAIEKKSSAIEAFINGYNKAVDAIHQDEAFARELLVKTLDLPEAIIDAINLPKFNKAHVPSEEYVLSMIEWVEKAQGISIDLSYQDIVEGSFTK